jgi:hypothetical protein
MIPVYDKVKSLDMQIIYSIFQEKTYAQNFFNSNLFPKYLRQHCSLAMAYLHAESKRTFTEAANKKISEDKQLHWSHEPA